MADIDADSDRITIKGEEANIGDIVEAWNAGKPLEVHPAADCFPMLEGKELQELAEDIKVHDLQNPIAFLRGKLLDGRCRFAAMGADRPKVDVNNISKFIEWLPDNTDPIPYVVSANSHRRHLIKKILADKIVERLKKLGHAEPVYRGGRGIKIL